MMTHCSYPNHGHRSRCGHVQQKISLPDADKRQKGWTRSEVDFVIDTVGEPLADVAHALGRTYYSVARKRLLLRKEGRL